MKKLIHLGKDDEDLFEEATDIFHQSFPHSQTVQEMYANPGTYIERTIVALKGDKVVGAIKRGYNPERDAISVDFLAVSPDYRNNGVGNLLLSEVEKFAIERAHRKICLFPRTKQEVVEFYIKRGYVFIQDYKPGWMEKMLI